MVRDETHHVTIERFTPHAHTNVLQHVVSCYQDVFAGSPWNEWKKCSVCNRTWGSGDKAAFQDGLVHCGVPLQDYWPSDRVENDLKHEITDDASCWIARQNGSVVGFCWGYPVAVTGLEKKLGIPIPLEFFRSRDIEHVAYQDEVGVAEAFRNQKIAKTLFKRRLEDFIAQGLTVGVVRTRQFPQPSVTFLWFSQKLGYETIARYPGDDGRVVLARNLEDLLILL